jgi:hypothetical protein
MIEFCAWCPESFRPEPLAHPNGQAEHISINPVVAALTERKEARERTGRPDALERTRRKR